MSGAVLISDSQKQPRQSGLELLRIVAMLFIVVFHLAYSQIPFRALSIPDVVLRSVTMTGVDMFVLISGYFGIRLRWWSLLNLWLMVTTFMLLSELMAFVVFGRPVGLTDVVNVLFSLTANGHYWFITCYFFLMLLSPVLNAGLDRLSGRQLVLLAALLVYANCFGGYVLHSQANPNGFTVVNLVFVYILGYSLRRLGVAQCKFRSRWWAIVWVGATVVIAMLYAGSGSNHAVDYNSPFIIAAAIALFIIACRLRFTSRIVNFAGRRMLAVYLLHMGPFGRMLYPLLAAMDINAIALWIPVYLIAMFGVAIALEWGRGLLMDTPVRRMAEWLTRLTGDFSQSSESSKTI